MNHIRLPGDKSLSHRSLMLAAVANGLSEFTNLSDGADVLSTLTCLTACGIAIDQIDEKTLVYGRGGAFDSPTGNLDAGNSGTTARLLTGLLAGRSISATIVGDESLSQRPFGRIADPLRQLGANIELAAHGGLPLKIFGADLSELDYAPPMSSAQVKSAILLSGLTSRGIVTVREQRRTRDHTERMLTAMGAEISIAEGAITIGAGPMSLNPAEGEIPGDPSSAAYPAALALMLGGREVQFEELLLNPTRIGFFETLRVMGADISWSVDKTFVGEDVGQLTVTSSKLVGIELEAEQIPSLIDELPMLAVIATQADGITRVTGAEELRVKESDRIRAICINLERMGANITELEDGFTIVGPTPLRGANITTYGDHRIAMAFAVARFLATGSTQLDDPGCLAISFPGCIDVLNSVAA